jgi:hypothetical protein
MAFVTVHDLVSRHGMGAVRTYLLALAKGSAFGEEFERQFGLSYAKFEEQLLKTAQEKS